MHEPVRAPQPNAVVTSTGARSRWASRGLAKKASSARPTGVVVMTWITGPHLSMSFSTVRPVCEWSSSPALSCTEIPK